MRVATRPKHVTLAIAKPKADHGFVTQGSEESVHTLESRFLGTVGYRFFRGRALPRSRMAEPAPLHAQSMTKPARPRSTPAAVAVDRSGQRNGGGLGNICDVQQSSRGLFRQLVSPQIKGCPQTRRTAARQIDASRNAGTGCFESLPGRGAGVDTIARSGRPIVHELDLRLDSISLKRWHGAWEM
jgi:hypothetical protein